MKKTFEYFHRFLFAITLILLIGSFSSCRSHKKSRHEVEKVYVGEQIDTGRNKIKQNNKIGEKIAKEAMTWIGTPYGYGHSEKGKSTDCSGMVLIVYRDVANIQLPRNSAEQADFCNTLKEKEIEPGDLVFFATGKDNKKVSHVGIMIDKCQFVHASGSKGVILSEMTTPYYQRAFIKYGRVPGVK